MKQKQNINYFEIIVFAFELMWIVRLKVVMFGRLSFGISVILLIAATSMSRRQTYGKGWVNGECYLVKGGTYATSAILILVTVGSLNGSAFSTIKSSQAHHDQKTIHKQMGRQWHCLKSPHFFFWLKTNEKQKGFGKWKVSSSTRRPPPRPPPSPPQNKL